MSTESSFDIVSEVNLQEVDNAVNQATKELINRFDFKGSKSSFSFNRMEKKIVFLADDEMKLKSLKDILTTKLAKRSVPLKAMRYLPEEKAFDGTIRQVAEIIQGIPQDEAKDIVRRIKDQKLKVQASIQGEKVRVTGKSKDDLQHVIQILRETNFKIPLQFSNFRTP